MQTLSYSIRVRSLIEIPLNHNLIKFRMRIQKESDPILPGMHRTTSRSHGRHVLCNFEGADNHEKIKDVLYSVSEIMLSNEKLVKTWISDLL